jgi:hypothetical protein
VTRTSARRRGLAGLAVAILALVPLTAGCGGDDPTAGALERERAADRDVAFKGCGQVRCTGEIDGAAYEIKLPEKWNGTLLLYSHGYRSAAPTPPSFEPVDTTAAAAPSDQDASALLAEGYALAGSAYKTNGWAVQDGVEAGEKLHTFFAKNVGAPHRVYVWGESLGGLITETLAEKHPDWVAGSAPMCGVLGGTNLNLDLALDEAYAVKTLIYPQLKLTGFASHDEAVQNWTAAYKALVKAGGDVKNGVPKILLIAALTDSPRQTKTYDGSTIESTVRALGEALLTGLGYGTWGRYDIEQRVGGNPSTNDGVDYTARVSAEERSLIDTVSPGATGRLLGQLAAGERVTADQAARDKADALGNPTGDLKDPTITLHTKADPLVLAQNESVFKDRVYGSARRTADLVQLYTLPPATYPQTSGAPYGAGHCNFTSAQRVGLITLLDGWVREGVVPGAASLPAVFPGDASVSQTYQAGPWPAAPVRS